MTEMTIRQAHAGDVDAIYEIERLCFADPWSRDALRQEFTDNPRAFYVVAEIEGEIVGYARVTVLSLNHLRELLQRTAGGDRLFRQLPAGVGISLP